MIGLIDPTFHNHGYGLSHRIRALVDVSPYTTSILSIKLLPKKTGSWVVVISNIFRATASVNLSLWSFWFIRPFSTLTLSRTLACVYEYVFWQSNWRLCCGKSAKSRSYKSKSLLGHGKYSWQNGLPDSYQI